MDYFTNFLKLKPFGTINESHVRFLSAAHDLACNSGIYTFDSVKDGEPQKVGFWPAGCWEGRTHVRLCSSKARGLLCPHTTSGSANYRLPDPFPRPQ